MVVHLVVNSLLSFGVLLSKMRVVAFLLCKQWLEWIDRSFIMYK